MTSTQIRKWREKFFKSHSADQYDSPQEAISDMLEWTRCQLGFDFERWVKERWNEITYSCNEQMVAHWWFMYKNSMAKDSIMGSMNEGYVTHGYVSIHAHADNHNWNNEFGKSDIVNLMFDFSFKYNIIGVSQKPGKLDIFLSLSKDHQTNIDSEIIEKVFRCLEF